MVRDTIGSFSYGNRTFPNFFLFKPLEDILISSENLPLIKEPSEKECESWVAKVSDEITSARGALMKNNVRQIPRGKMHRASARSFGAKGRSWTRAPSGFAVLPSAQGAIRVPMDGFLVRLVLAGR